MQLLRLCTVCLMVSLMVAIPSAAQRSAPAVTLAHIDLNSADPAAATAFWKDVIGTAIYSSGSLSGVSMIGAQIVITRNTPSGPSPGSAIDHLAIRVPDLQPFVERLAKTSYKSFQPTPGADVLMIDGPDGVRIELTQDSSMYAPLEFDHIHLRTSQPSETQAWYGKHFGARPNTEDDLHTSRLSGGTLTFTQGESVPTMGRAIDHISFEVKDLESFCKTLTDDGIKLDRAGAAAFFLTDPWGTRIELTSAARD